MASRGACLSGRRLVASLLLLFAPVFLFAVTHLKSMEMGYNRLTLHFDKAFSKDQVKSFVLQGKGSFRYVFDLKNCRLAGKHLTDGLKYSDKIRSIRVGQYRRNTVRVVVETPEPYAVAHYALESTSYAIVLPKGSSDLSSSIKGLFAGLKKKPAKQPAPTTRTKRTPSKKRPPKPAQKAGKKSRIMADAPARPHKRYTIIVDPGHGGHDSGAQDPTRRYWEKRAVLAIALKLRKHLRKMGFDVIMTRSSDRFIKLHRRTRYANLKHGDVFVSIHANAVGSRSRASKVHGIETYYLSPARSARARRVAAKENSIAFKKYYKNSMNTFLKTLTRSKIILSNKLAIDVQRGMLARLREIYKGVVDGGVRPAPFWVLVGAEMPAVLVETGYITHPWEKKRLYNPSYQDRLARGIAEGIARYLKNRERELE
jgi:N-acetylmuramoyl-L-alanine amidase